MTALDVAAARRLADYGDLDDAGVARALEHMHMQRWGRRDSPGHLRRIDALAAVVLDGDRLEVIAPKSRAGEQQQLQALFDAWPGGSVELVDWDGTSRSLLIARALAHELMLPPALENTTARALVEFAAPVAADHPAPADQTEAEALQLLTGWRPSDREAPALVALAIARCRLWLRWQYCRGGLDRAARAAWQARLDQQRPAAPR